jgi:hypothetical protein
VRTRVQIMPGKLQERWRTCQTNMKCGVDETGPELRLHGLFFFLTVLGALVCSTTYYLGKVYTSTVRSAQLRRLSMSAPHFQSGEMNALTRRQWRAILAERPEKTTLLANVQCVAILVFGCVGRSCVITLAQGGLHIDSACAVDTADGLNLRNR